MADPSFHEEQWKHRYDPHIAPINTFVDELRRDRWAPYVAPMYGGIGARLLSLLRDPGPRTREDVGSSFLSMENDDRTAAMLAELFANAGIAASDVVPWNVYPWYINRAPTRAELVEGVGPLKRLIALLPRLRVVMLHGHDARRGWRVLERQQPDFRRIRRLEVIETYHTSPQAFRTPDAAERDRRRQHLIDSFSSAARLVPRI